MKLLKILVVSVISLFLLVAVAGFIKFNFIDVPYVGGAKVYISEDGKQLELHHKADGSVKVRFSLNGKPIEFIAIAETISSGSQYVAKDGDFIVWTKGTKARVLDAMWQSHFSGLEAANQQVETIRFSQSQQRWFDDVGTCHTCTPDNGFGQDGSVDHVIWQELIVGLSNDLGEPPAIDEVQMLFEQEYAEQPGYYPVYVSYNSAKFTILVAVAKELKGIDFLERTGPLLATYEVSVD